MPNLTWIWFDAFKKKNPQDITQASAPKTNRVGSLNVPFAPVKQDFWFISSQTPGMKKVENLAAIPKQSIDHSPFKLPAMTGNEPQGVPDISTMVNDPAGLKLWGTMTAPLGGNTTIRPSTSIDRGTIHSAIKDVFATVQDTPNITEEEFNATFPEFAGKQDALRDLIATAQDMPNITPEEVESTFPELFTSNYTPPQWSKFSQIPGNAGEEETNIFGIPKIPRFNEFDEGNDGTVGDVFKGFWKNLLKSGANLLSDVGNTILDPVDSVTGLAKLWAGGVTNLYESAIGDEVDGQLWEYGDTAAQVGKYFTDRYGSMEWFSDASYKDPVWVFSDIVSLIAGGATLAGKWAKLGGLTRTADVLSDVSKIGAVDPANILMNQTYKAKDTLRSKTKEVGWSIASSTKKGTDRVNSVKSGLSETEKKGIQNNPLQGQYRDETKVIIDETGVPAKLSTLTVEPSKSLGQELANSMQDFETKFSDYWPLYEDIHKLKDDIVLTQGVKEIESKLNDYWVKVKSNWIEFDKQAMTKKWIVLTSADETNIKDLLDVIKSSDTVKPTEILWIRKAADKFAKRDKVNPWDWPSIIKMIRGEIDKVAKEQVPQLAETDKLWSKAISEIDQIKNGLFYVQWPKKWQLRDNYYQIMKTLGNENRGKMLQRLEQIMPDIKYRVEAINNLPLLAKAYTDTSTLSKVVKSVWGSIWLGSLGYNMGGVGGAFVGAILWWVWMAVGDSITSKIRKTELAKIFSTMSDEAKSALNEVSKKMENRSILTEGDRKLVDQLKKKLELKLALQKRASEVAASTPKTSTSLIPVSETPLESRWYTQKITTPQRRITELDPKWVPYDQKLDDFRKALAKKKLGKKLDEKKKLSSLSDTEAKESTIPPKGLQSIHEEARKYKSAEEFTDWVWKSIDDYTDWDFLTAKPRWKEKERLNFIKYATAKYPPKQGQWWIYSVQKIREEANRKS